ncbi:hypothetical protein KAI46_05190 [bacterium]|nr:hypothetical protein [bacterium]
MLTAISIFDEKTENTLNIYRDPGTGQINIDICGGDMVGLSADDCTQVMQFMDKTEILTT